MVAIAMIVPLILRVWSKLQVPGEDALGLVSVLGTDRLHSM